MEKQLLRSRENKMIAGVCGGVAEYFLVDTTIVRIIWVAITLAFLPGGIIAYIVAAIVMPEKQVDFSGAVQQNNNENEASGKNGEANDQNKNFDNIKEPVKSDPQKTRIVIGGVLVFLGVLFLAKELFIFDVRYLWPLLFIGIGTFIIYKGRKK